MYSIQPSPLLKFAFGADAAVSLAVALLQLFVPDDLSRLLLLPRMLLVESGIFLAAYALLLAVLARSRTLARALVLFLIVGNAGWAAGCALVGFLAAPSGLGFAFLAVQASTVLLFAWLQLAGLKASSAALASPGAQQSA